MGVTFLNFDNFKELNESYSVTTNPLWNEMLMGLWMHKDMTIIGGYYETEVLEFFDEAFGTRLDDWIGNSRSIFKKPRFPSDEKKLKQSPVSHRSECSQGFWKAYSSGNFEWKFEDEISYERNGRDINIEKLKSDIITKFEKVDWKVWDAGYYTRWTPDNKIFEVLLYRPISDKRRKERSKSLVKLLGVRDFDKNDIEFLKETYLLHDDKKPAEVRVKVKRFGI